MNKQPTALQLAEVSPYLEGGERSQWIMTAAAELRRLHAELVESEKWRDRDEARAANAERERDIAEAQRDALLDALLDALRGLLSYANVLEMRLLNADGEHPAMQQARAAIATVEGEKT